MVKIILRKANKNDSADLLRWANDPATRKASFNSEPIAAETHREWFKHSLKNSKRRIYIALNENNKKIGVIRFDLINKQTAELDINLAPEMRGQGLGAELISAGCQNFLADSGKVLFLARIKEANQPSIKAFKKAGFFELFHYNNAQHGPAVALGRAT